MTDTYLSIASESTGTYRDKASKFLSFSYPVAGEDEVRDRMQQLRKKYHDANHHCFAYRLGPEGIQYRVSDDGEPSGSAGKPILGQLISFKVSDVLIVVVRYFGGTKLGIPGLINAYRSSARQSLENATIFTKFIESKILVTFPFEEMNSIMKIVKTPGVTILTKVLDQECQFELMVRKSLGDSIRDRLTKASKALMVKEG
ncbi:MAG: YigZ family protein [bacterium]